MRKGGPLGLMPRGTLTDLSVPYHLGRLGIKPLRQAAKARHDSLLDR